MENWLLADSDAQDAKSLADDTALRYDTLGCIGKVKDKTVVLVRHRGALEEDCRTAEIVIAPFTVPKSCRAARVIFDPRALKTGGAHALYIDGLSIQTEMVTQAHGKRPWTRREEARQANTPDGVR